MMVVMVIVAAVMARRTPPYTPRGTYQLHECLSRPWHAPEGHMAPVPGLQEEEPPQGSSRRPPHGSANHLADQDVLKVAQGSQGLRAPGGRLVYNKSKEIHMAIIATNATSITVTVMVRMAMLVVFIATAMT